MKHIYLFNKKSWASVYGIGTYIRQLSLCLSGEKEGALHIVNLHANEDEFKTEKLQDGCTVYHFPNINVQSNMSQSDRYYRNIWFILSSFISKTGDSDELYFHLNYIHHYPLIKLMKKKYPHCFILFAIHYQEWSFLIKGNTSYFRRIINEKSKRSKNDIEKSIVLQYKREKKFYDAVDHILCLSRYAKEILLKDYCIPKRKISLTYNGLQDEANLLTKSEKVKIKKQLFFSENSRIILFVGRLDEIKGVDVLIDAFKLLLKQMPDAHLVIIGDGDFSTYLHRSKDIWHKITFTGRLDRGDLYTFYQIADVGVMPSTHEQCSYVAIEMMMFGLPMVVSTSTGLSEMLTGENSTYKVDVKEMNDKVVLSAVSFKNKIIKALSDKGYGARMREQYENMYDLKHMKESYMNSVFNLDK